MDIPCPLSALAGALLLCAGAAPASAQTYRHDAEAYPCTGGAQLAIVQSDLGFSIRKKADLPASPVAPTAVKIGNSLTLDSRLFARASLIRPESAHVPQR